MLDLTRRTALAGAAVAAAAAALPCASLAGIADFEQSIRAVLAANVEKSACEMAAAIERGASTRTIEHFFRFARELNQDELQQFDRYQGSWRHVYGLSIIDT